MDVQFILYGIHSKWTFYTFNLFNTFNMETLSASTDASVRAFAAPAPRPDTIPL